MERTVERIGIWNRTIESIQSEQLRKSTEKQWIESKEQVRL